MNTQKPNILFLMTDQMQGRVLQSDNACITPHLDRLASDGVRIANAYTPNPVCSPARASLMTGLLPHNHGVLHVTHCVDDDQCCLRKQHPHWAQQLEKSGYATAYFGKWHVERTNRLEDFGWQINCGAASAMYGNKQAALQSSHHGDLLMAGYCKGPAGYNDTVLYGTTSRPPSQRTMGLVTELALDYLREAVTTDDPWCCFVSTTEPHNPFICSQETFELYDVDALELPASAHDDLEGRPGLYRKARRSWNHLTDRQRRESMACYYGLITEIDAQYGRILQLLEESGQSENTIVIFTSDHGEFLGSHGLYTKNVCAGEEAYHIPLLLRGPAIARGAVADARVGLHDLYPTILDLTGCPTITAHDSRSFAPLLRDPGLSDNYQQGFAEYSGTRVNFTQRVTWDGSWKYVFNGFDEDELYNLEADPWEMHNLINDPNCDEILRRMSAQMWRRMQATNDKTLLNLGNPSLRVATYGPEISQYLPSE